MAEARKRYTAKEKDEITKKSNCYVCDDLGLEHAGFDGYDRRDIHLDHYQTPHGNVGASNADGVLPIHAAAGGSTADESDYETSTNRNCHRLRSNNYNSRAGYVQVLRARMQLRTVSFVDDVYGNIDRKPNSRKYNLPAKWSGTSVQFIGKTYPVISEVRASQSWNRFLTTLKPSQVFTDDTSQVRPGAKKTLNLMVRTFLVDGFPMFAPVNARIDKCGHVVIFDGNHRATSHALAFGVEEPMPVMIWDIQTGDECALRAHVSSSSKS